MGGLFFLWFYILFTTRLVLTHSQVIVKPGCQTKCGDVDIPYPFGLSPNCSMNGFMLNCSTINGTIKPSFFNVEITDILLSVGRVRMRNHISWQCYNTTSRKIFGDYWHLNFRPTPYRFSDVHNKFTTIGCETLAYIDDSDATKPYHSGCVSMCSDTSSLSNGSCSGIGCCQTTIPKNLRYYKVRFDPNFNNSRVWHYSLCSYAVLLESDWFEFNTKYITTADFWVQNNAQVPLIIDWAIQNATCEQAKGNPASYACVSNNSECLNSQNGPGYLCNCTSGYKGNPYLPDGCQDIDECADPKPICDYGNCNNSQGSYTCLCPPGTHNVSSGGGACVPDQKLPLSVKLVLGISVGLLVLLLCLSFGYMANERSKLAMLKEKYFQQYGGIILLQEMKSMHDKNVDFTVFSEKEVKEATNNFDETKVIGEGANGTVFKGTLHDHVLAIKRCKTINERQKKEFGKEMLILSRLNHTHIVKIRGCCLEVKIPILVYEYISNGTLYNLIHTPKNTSRIPLPSRLRIAQEAAQALSYLHSWASPPIVHRDVKSSNILLNEKFEAKVSDFGASVLAPVDTDQCLTLVQGTPGYLDPEYVQSGQLTVKSDVYSFGVVLLELLTRKKAFYFDRPEEERSLSSRFLSVMKQNRLEEILDDEIVNEQDLSLIKEVAKLAKKCLNMEGEKRPEMKEVAEELATLRKTMKHPWGREKYEEIDSLIGEGESSSSTTHESTAYFSLEKKAMLGMESGR